MFHENSTISFEIYHFLPHHSLLLHTNKAKYLNQLSNHGRPGSWIYRVGPIPFEENIEEPAAERFPVRNVEPRTCAEGGRLKCHPLATCQDTRYGYTCRCKPAYYGNGQTCIKNDVPVRVSGQISGRISGADVHASIQSYVVLNDGRSYTAINPLDAGLGFSSQLAHSFGYVIGWLFAKPVGSDAPNGYEVSIRRRLLGYLEFSFVGMLNYV